MGTRYVITGSQGQLGRCLVRDLGRGGADELVAAYSHRDLDISNGAAVQRVFQDLSAGPGGPPEVCVNAAAYNAVDLCESEGAELARQVNGEAPGLLATACEKVGARFVHVSTDYVFPGDATSPVSEAAEPAPRSAYGRSKLEGERRVQAASPEALVVRTSWVFGPGKNFVGAILRQGRMRKRGEAKGPLTVVDDQVGCPTYAADLATGIRELVSATHPGPGRGGVYHLSNACGGSEPSWWDFARAILDGAGYADLEILRGQTSDLSVAAPRPAYSVLGCQRASAQGVTLRPWRDALTAYLGSADLETTLALTDPAHG